MTTVDFDAWAVPPLTITLDGHTYAVPAPTVAHTRVLAAYTRLLLADVGAGGEPVDEDRAIAHEPIASGVLGGLADQMAADGVPAETVDRVAVYAALYWTRGKADADLLATALWDATAATSSTSTPRRRAATRTRS